MTTLGITLIILAVTVLVSFIYGLLTRNYSTVDRLWSILPPVYMLVWLPDYSDSPRYLISLIIVLLWGSRLTANFAIKGGYRFSFRKGFEGEDYRWEILRGRITNRFLFELFNLVFISAFQLGLIFMFTLPLYFYGKIADPISSAEYILYGIHLLLLGCEMYADILQLRFFRRKNLAPWNTQRRYKLGFNTFGVWRLSRHPNYVCEFSQWVVVYLYLAVASKALHFSGIGAVVLVFLFAGSTVFAESITGSKYPGYSEWKKLTSVWFPVKSFFRSAEKTRFLDT